MDAMQKPKVTEESLEYLIQNKAPFYKIQQAVHKSGVYYLDKDQQTRPALHLATKLGQDKVVTLLLDSGADINEFDNYFTALQVSIMKEKVSCFRILVQRNADVNLKRPNAEPPIIILIQFIFYGPRQIVKEIIALLHLLLEAGADVNAFCTSSVSVLMYAIKSRRPDIFQTIMSFKPCLGLRNKYGQSPLHIAAMGSGSSFDDRIRQIKALIEGGADVTARDMHGNTVLHYVCMGYFYCQDDFEQLVELFQANGADINALNYDQITPLFLVVQPDLRRERKQGIHMGCIVDGLINSGAWLNVGNYDVRETVTQFSIITSFPFYISDTTPGHTLINFQYELVDPEAGWGVVNVIPEFEWLISCNVDVDMRNCKKQGLLHRLVQIDVSSDSELSQSDSDYQSDYL